MNLEVKLMSEVEEMAKILVNTLNRCDRVCFSEREITLHIGDSEQTILKDKNNFWYILRIGKGSK